MLPRNINYISLQSKILPPQKESSKGLLLNNFDTIVHIDGSKIDCGVGAATPMDLKLKNLYVFLMTVVSSGGSTDFSFKGNIATLLDSQAAT